MPATLQEAFRLGFGRYASTRRLPLHVYRAASAIVRCRTAALGGHLRLCPEGHERQIHYNSCRHRACPQCAWIRSQHWLESRSAQLLPCSHFHIVFTTPHELEPLWFADRSAMSELLLASARDTLLELLADPKHLGARPGVIAALHTWGRTLSFHPHVHCLVTGGGLGDDGWRSVRGGFLLPVRVVRALFRGKFLAALRSAHSQGQLRGLSDREHSAFEHLVARCTRRSWNVRIQEQYAQGRGVLTYLARYLRGGPIGNQRIVEVTEQRAVFRYTDHRDQRRKTLVLPLEHFVQRLIWHVPEPRRQSVRYFGLYARGSAAAREQCRGLLEAETKPQGELRSAPQPARSVAPAAPAEPPRCSVCQRRLIVRELRRPGRSPPVRRCA